MATREQKIQNDIRVALSKNECTVFRVNVGSVRTPDGRYFKTGVPSGYSDLSGFKWSNGKAFFIEVKTKTGKPRLDQIRFNKFLISKHIICGIARSPEDALKIVNEELVGYGFTERDLARC